MHVTSQCIASYAWLFSLTTFLFELPVFFMMFRLQLCLQLVNVYFMHTSYTVGSAYCYASVTCIYGEPHDVRAFCIKVRLFVA